jgi:hypothetical protein
VRRAFFAGDGSEFQVDATLLDFNGSADFSNSIQVSSGDKGIRNTNGNLTLEGSSGVVYVWDSATANQPFLRVYNTAGTDFVSLAHDATNAVIAASTGSIVLNDDVQIVGAVTAATIANSDSETLVAGQLHFIDGNATLPNLTAGQWIQVVNDSASPITISKNGSDTTYWAASGASVSTSFTLAARGVLTARCNPAGTAVYVTGSGITAAS